MTTCVFKVKQKIIPGQHAHTWECTDTSSGATFPLPQGGNGKLVGAYPEIEVHMKTAYQKAFPLRYTPPLDSFTPDYAVGLYEWRFRRSGDDIVVKDIPRLVTSVEFSNV